MSNFDDLERILNGFGPEDDKSFDFVRSNNKKKEDYYLQAFVGWQCPICWEIYNPHVLNCVKDHTYGKRHNNSL